MDRREYLRGVGVGAVAAFAGCADLLGYEPDDRNQAGQTPTEDDETSTAPPPATPTQRPTRTVTEQPTPTRSPTPEPTSAPTTTPTPTSTPTDSPTASPLPSPTPTRSPTPTPTPTETPDRAPRLVDGTLVESWPGAADFDDNAMGAVGRGATAEVGFAFDVWAGDGQARVAAEATVFHRGEEVASESRTDARVVERADEFTRLYWALPFDTTEWALGEHTAEITLRDRNLDVAASPYRFDFEVAQPLEGEEATYVRYEGPDPVTAGEPFEFEVYVRNESRRDSSVVSTVQERRNVDEWYKTDPSVALNLASGNERSFGGEWQVDRPGNYEWRLPGVDVTWHVEVEAAD